MGFADQYLSRQPSYNIKYHPEPSGKLRFIVVVPCYNEPELIISLESLWNAKRPEGHVEVIVVVNSPEEAGKEITAVNQRTTADVKNWISKHSDDTFGFSIIEELQLPKKHAGVGLARKIGMDLALSMFNASNHTEGLIISFDADSICDNNFFTAIENACKKYPDANGFNLYFEHPVSGSEYSQIIYDGIVLYELHLRYVVRFLRVIGFPFAFHTIGSAFAVKAGVYALQGGMNKRQAGEDFYFLHKIIPLGDFYEINTTRVIPSPRPSDRVPFGTGNSVKNYMQQKDKIFLTYNPQSFLSLRPFFYLTEKLYKASEADIKALIAGLAGPLQHYLSTLDAVKKITEINKNCRSLHSFVKRFFRWFDAFRVVKYLNFVSIDYYPQLYVADTVKELLTQMGEEFPDNCTAKDLLLQMRDLDKQQVFTISYPR